MEAAQTHLRLAADTGEVVDHESLHKRIRELQDQLDGAAKDIAAWRIRYANLKRDVEQEARENPLWSQAVELFKFWQRMTGHTKSEWAADRFALVEPFLKKDGPLMCRIAIVGAAYDPFVTRRKNGSIKRHDGWDLIFRNREKFEEMANRAPPVVYRDAMWFAEKEKGGWTGSEDKVANDRPS